MSEHVLDAGRGKHPIDDVDSKRGPLGRLRLSSLRDSLLIFILAAIWAFFYFATDGTFLTQRNLVLLALQTSIVSLAAISAVMLIVTRNFDLSVGSAVAGSVTAKH